MNVMYFYEVMVASQKYQKDDLLTYSAAEKLVPGTLIKSTLQNTPVLAVVVNQTVKPSFKVLEARTILGSPLPPESLQLIQWLKDYYPAPSGSIVSHFVPKFLSTKQGHALPEQSIPKGKNAKTAALSTLTKNQTAALDALKKAPVSLLHGDTGSGKTRVYAELAKEALQNGKNVLILTPEIGLTPQLTRYFTESFGNSVFIIHSGLTESQRRTTWRTISEQRDTPYIVIGTRSSLFLPFRTLGLLVVDEFHDNSYKNEGQPRYDGKRVASRLAQLHGAKIVFGSATPQVSEYFIAQEKSVPIIRMKGSAVKNDHDYTVQLVSILQRDKFKKNPYISDDLITALGGALQRGEQALIFLNRRGTARTVLCDNCGWQALCPRCDVPLTYHGDTHTYQCHTCGYAEKPANHCPVCQNTELVYKGAGTKALIEMLRKFYPQANIQRFDTDSKKEDRLESHYEEIFDGNVDILVGTQVLAKGLDLPNLGVVGVISADTSLAFPDFTAEERTYQLLVQIIGRVGRGHRAGTVIVQSVHPDSTVIASALQKDWARFYARELEERRKYLFPPYCYLLKLTCARKTPRGAERAADELAARIKQMKLPVQVTGPAPAFHAKSGQNYIWNLVIKSKKRGHLTKIVTSLPSGWSYDLDPIALL